MDCITYVSICVLEREVGEVGANAVSGGKSSCFHTQMD